MARLRDAVRRERLREAAKQDQRIDQLTAERDAARQALSEVMEAQGTRIAELEAHAKALLDALSSTQPLAWQSTIVAVDRLRAALAATAEVR
jgi:septal ring factor EnvC (AmiA/AmiB activator)